MKLGVMAGSTARQFLMTARCSMHGAWADAAKLQLRRFRSAPSAIPMHRLVSTKMMVMAMLMPVSARLPGCRQPAGQLAEL